MRPFLRTSRLLLRPLSSRPPIRPLLPHPQNLHTTPSHLHPQTTSLERGTSNTPLEGHNSDTPSASPGLSGLDIYSDLPSPINSIEALYNTHFLLTNGTATAPGSGVFLLNDSAFAWTPDVSVDAGRVEFGKGAWGVLEIVWPKPELLIIGTGKRTLLLSPEDRERISELGVRIDVMDTGSAAAQFNLLATERGGGVAGALLVGGFTGGGGGNGRKR